MKQRKDGRFEEKVFIGYDEKAKKLYKSFYGKTQKDVKEKIADFKREMKVNQNYIQSFDSFSIWANKWLDHKIKYDSIGQSQQSNYKSNINKICDYIGDVSIKDVTRDDIQTIISDYYECNPKTHNPSSKRTLTYIKDTASQIFDYAIKSEVILRNPVISVDIPKDASVTERRALTEFERQMIEDTSNRRGVDKEGNAKDEYGMQVPAMIMLYGGLRRGEVIPLKWSDVDLDKGTITVNKAIYFLNGKAKLKDTKTKSGNRVVHIPVKLITYLKQIKQHRVLNINNLVCPSLDGNMYSYTSWRVAWNCYMQDLDVKYNKSGRDSKYDKTNNEITIDTFTAHCLRHTFGTMLYASGVDIKTIQLEMGHADIKTTMNRYVHDDIKHRENEMTKYTQAYS